MPDEAEPGETDPVAAGDRFGGVEDAGDFGDPGARRGGQRVRARRQAAGRNQDARGEDEAQRVEGLGIELAEDGLDERIVRAPDERHQEQEPVEAGHAESRGFRASGRFGVLGDAP